jgi:hypothetical protein
MDFRVEGHDALASFWIHFHDIPVILQPRRHVSEAEVHKIGSHESLLKTSTDSGFGRVFHCQVLGFVGDNALYVTCARLG